MPRSGQARGVLCTGRLYCDVVLSGLPRFPTPGTEIFAEGLGLRAGGGAFTTAAYLSALGRAAHLAAVLPPPPFDRIVGADIAAAGISIAASPAAAPSPEPQITVALVGAGDRAFVTRRSGAAAPPLPESPPSEAGIGHLHVGELATLVSCPWLVDYARRHGLSLSLDCGWDESLDAAAVAGLVAAVDLFLPNEAEVDWLAGLDVRPGAGVQWVVKQGAQGARALGQPAIASPAVPAEVVDPTGAGDAFNAGFLDLWLDGAPMDACLSAGNACGAVAVGCLGGFDAERAGAALAARPRRALP